MGKNTAQAHSSDPSNSKKNRNRSRSGLPTRKADRDHDSDSDNDVEKWEPDYDPNDEKVRLTGSDIPTSYQLYNEILQMDQSLPAQAADHDPLVNMFIDFTEEDVQADETVLARMKNRMPDIYRRAREVLTEYCIDVIFGKNHDTSTVNGRFVYRALSRFVELPTKLEQECALFTIVAGVVLRRELAKSPDELREQVTDPFQDNRNVWNLEDTDLTKEHTVPHPAVFAIFLWVAVDPHIFEFGTTPAYMLMGAPPVFNHEVLLRKWTTGEMPVNVQTLLNLKRPPTVPKDYLTNLSSLHGNFCPGDVRRCNPLKTFLKSWWASAPKYANLVFHVENYLFFENRRIQCLESCDKADALEMTRQAKDFCVTNPLLEPWVPSPDKRLDLYDEDDPLREKYERNARTERLREAMREKQNQESARPSATANPTDSTPLAATTKKALFATAPTFTKGIDGVVSFTSQEEMMEYMRHTMSKAAPAPTTTVTSVVSLQTNVKQLRGPDPGLSFGQKEYAQIRPFKEFLEKSGILMDTPEYFAARNERIDNQWAEIFDLTVFFDRDAGYWKTLTHVAFFRSLTKEFLHAEDSAKSQTYAERVEEWIEKELSAVAHKNHLWRGLWSQDLKEWQTAAQQYLGIRSVTQPDQADLEPHSKTQADLVKRLRKMLFTKAEYFKSRNEPQFHSFLLDIDDALDRKRCEGSSDGSSSSKEPVRLDKPTGVDSRHTSAPTVHDYLRIAMVTGKQIQDIIQQAAVYNNVLYRTVQGGGSNLPNPHRHKQLRKTDTGGSPGKGSKSDSGKGKPRPVEDNEEGEEKDDDEEEAPPKNKPPYCNGCGKRHPEGCFLGPDKANHPDWNSTDKKWSESTYGLLWAKKDKKNLPSNKSLKDPNWVNPDLKDKPKGGEKQSGNNKKRAFSKNKDKRDQDKDAKKSKKCKFTETVLDYYDDDSEVRSDHSYSSKNTWRPTYLCTTIVPKSRRQHDYLLTCSVSVPNHTHIFDTELTCLIDTGALDRNYVSRDVAELLAQAGGHMKQCDVDKICSCNKSVCMPCLGIVSFEFTL